MATIPFTQGYLRFLMRREDVQEYHLGSINEEVMSRLTVTQATLNAPSFAVVLCPPFRPSASSKDLLFKPSRFEDKLYIRHLNRRLCRAYNIRHTNRHDIVRQVRELMKADAYLTIVRSDIRRFFRNIDFSKLLDRLRLDGFLSSVELDAIVSIASFTAGFQPKGIPWGLSISSTLAEIYLRDFDALMRSTQHAYYYQRFVDDIVIFSASEAQFMVHCLEGRLSNIGLRLNLDKTVAISESHTSAAHFSYLGYEFKRTLVVNKKGLISESSVDVTIAPTKVERLRKRVGESMSRFYVDRNWRDLRDRIKVLTGNYTIEKSSHEAPIKTGIYFNYKEITNTSQLELLDVFLRNSLFALRSWIRRHGATVHRFKLSELYRFSFSSGFKNKVLHRISPHRLNQLGSVWSE
jgi:Reverse transcriptase (RNA-dependent DNA polymerase)